MPFLLFYDFYSFFSLFSLHNLSSFFSPLSNFSLLLIFFYFFPVFSYFTFFTFWKFLWLLFLLYCFIFPTFSPSLLFSLVSSFFSYFVLFFFPPCYYFFIQFYTSKIFVSIFFPFSCPQTISPLFFFSLVCLARFPLTPFPFVCFIYGEIPDGVFLKSFVVLRVHSFDVPFTALSFMEFRFPFVPTLLYFYCSCFWLLFPVVQACLLCQTFLMFQSIFLLLSLYLFLLSFLFVLFLLYSYLYLQNLPHISKCSSWAIPSLCFSIPSPFLFISFFFSDI